MTDIGKTIFNLQRTLILQIAINPETERRIPIDYLFAWYHKIFPFFDSGELHEDLSEYFEITKEQIDILKEYLDKEWLESRTYTFYEIEKEFKKRNKDYSRIELIYILKYIYLSEGFDDAFWKKLLTPMQHPVEARSIISEFSVNEIYLV